MPHTQGASSQTGASPTPAAAPNRDQASIRLTPELVRQITDKVYIMLLAELHIERERAGAHRRASSHWREDKSC